MVADASAPISPQWPGHGLGQAVHRSSLALQLAGHKVTVFAPEHSATNEPYKTVIACPVGKYENEKVLAKSAIMRQEEFDIIIDHTHTKTVSYYAPHLPILSWYHDIFMRPLAKNPVMVSQGMKYLQGMQWAKDAPVVHHWVDENEYTFNAEPDHPPYVMFMGIFREYKQPILAIQAAALAGVRLVVAGTIPGGISPFMQHNYEVVYVGGVIGGRKVKLLQGASAFLQFGNVESFGLTTAEAALCGTPVVAWPAGGTLDLIEYKRGVEPQSGVYMQVSRSQARSAADSIKYAMSLPRRPVREHMAMKVSRESHINSVGGLISGVVPKRKVKRVVRHKGGLKAVEE
jgi:glycosyltransferase involved in cell wall biosynthesis